MSGSSSKPKKLEGNPDANLASIGNYLFQKTVGEGNFAKVKLAKHKITSQEVAIKIIDKTSLDEKKLSKLYREVRIMKMLHHPNIVKLYEVIETKHTIFLVMEYVSGGELYDYLVVHGRMKEKEARAKFRQIISAVSYCHKKRVIHRDLKAENLLLDQNLNIKIADFGFSNQYDPDGKLDTFCGSPPYAAPELFQGKRYTGPEVDVWSLGVILYVLTTGCLPFDGKNLQEMRESVCRGKYRIPFYLSENCEKLLRKFLVRDPTKRPDLDILADDSWMNEGYDDSPVTKPVAEEIVQEDPFIINLMETKFGIDRDTIAKGLRENVYDDAMAIYFLLYSEKERSGEGAIAKLGDQSLTRSASAPSSVAPTPELPRVAPVAQAPAQPISVIREEDGSKDDVSKNDNAADLPAAIPRKVTVQRTATTRRQTVSGEADIKKLAEEHGKEETDMLRKLKDLQLKNIPDEGRPLAAVTGSPVFPRLRVEDGASKARPMSVAGPDAAMVVPPIASLKKEVAAEAATASAGSDKKIDVGRKRTTTITGLLKTRNRGSDGTEHGASSSAQASTVDEQPKLLGEDDGSDQSLDPNDSKPRSLRFTFNSNTTSSKAPDDIMQEVLGACTKHDIKPRLISRFLVECIAAPVTTLPGAELVKIEIEVCKLPRLKNMHGLRFKRTSGSSNDYKVVSEKILTTIQL